MATKLEAKKEEERNVFDEILVHIGEFGLYQKRLLLLLLIPGMLCAMHKLAWVFLGAYADHRCLLPTEHKHNASFFLADQQQISKCFKNANESCEHWIFDTSEYPSSAVFEFELVCEWDWARGTANTALVIGGLIGAVIFGNLSDSFGRRPVFFIALALQALVGVMASVVPTFWSYVISRVLLGATVPGVYITSCVLGIEMVGPSKRQYAVVIIQIFFSIGFLMTALIAYFINDWRHLQLALSLPGLLCLAYWRLMPESCRWLVGQGRIYEASTILHKAAEINGTIQTEESLLRLNKLLSTVQSTRDEEDKEKIKRPTLIQLLLNFPRLRRRALTMLAIWFVNGLAYFGLSWNTGDLAGNDYLNFSVSGLVEIPAHTCVLFLVNWKGRVPTQSGTLFCAGISLLIATVIPADFPWLLTTLAMLGKLTVTSSYGTAYIFSAEIFPTSVRNAGLGACSFMSALGAIAASFVVLLSSWWSRLPFILLGSLSLVAGFLATTLPETLNSELPDSLQDGENFKSSKKSPLKSNNSMIDVKV